MELIMLNIAMTFNPQKKKINVQDTRIIYKENT